MTTLLDRCQLIFKVHAGSACVDHGFHQFESVKNATETGFSISHNRREEVDVIFTFGPLNLVSTLEGVIDTLNNHWHRICWIQRLVRVHFTSQIGVACHLPARQVNRFQASLDLLHGLIASQSAQRIDERLVVEQIPQLVCTALC